MPDPTPTEEPGWDDRLEAIVNTLAAVDRNGHPAEWQTDEVRFLVTLLWFTHLLRIQTEWARVTIEQLHTGCLGCDICSGVFEIDITLRETEAVAVWPLWPDLRIGRQRGDNLLSF